MTTQSIEDNRVVSLALLAAVVAWTGSLALVPLAPGVSSTLTGVVYAAGSLVCHQIPDRSFHLAGVQLPVCARCAGLYAGAAIGVLAWWVAGRGRRVRWPRSSALRTLAVAALPTAVTAATAWAGVADPSNSWRAVLALPLGIVGGLMAAAAASDHLQ
jgi:uncharacterized membrane protein